MDDDFDEMVLVTCSLHVFTMVRMVDTLRS